MIYGGARGQNGSPNCASHAQLVELFPESERDFFAKSMDIWMTFETDTEGRATALILQRAVPT